MAADLFLLQANATTIPLRSGSVHSIVTSPPYYRQRKYDVAMAWPAVEFWPSPHLSTTWTVEEWEGELGWEAHPLDFVGHLLLAFKECYRVLREDGSLWVNVGDKRSPDRQWHGVPDMLVAALVASGWRHEDTVIWHKPSAMPGSQTNRFTRDFEYVFVMNKSKEAFFDVGATREPFASDWTQKGGSFRNPTGWAAKAGRGANVRVDRIPKDGRTRTRRAVWSINPKGTGLGHYAAFPVALVTPMLRASISERGCCPSCGAGWRRVVERQETTSDGRPKATPPDCPSHLATNHPRLKGQLAYKVQTIAWRPACHCHGSPSRGPVRCTACKGTGREQKYQRGQQGWTKGAVGEGQPQRDSSGGIVGLPAIETGKPCPHCSGTGTVTGDVWPDDVDDWPVAPSVVVDPFCGTGTVGESLARMQVGNEYPATFVGLDYSHGYLADLARERLGLKALAAWGHGIDGGDGAEALRVLAAEAGGGQLGLECQ